MLKSSVWNDALFPVLIIGDYLLMSSGLAADAHNSVSPYELLNSPLVCVFCCGRVDGGRGSYHWLWGAGLPSRRLTRIGFTGAGGV